MSSHQNNQNMHQQQQQQQPGSGLTRYRSAPSSYFSNLLNTNTNGFGPDEFEHLFNPRATSPESQRIFSRFTPTSNPDKLSQNCFVSQSQPQYLPPPIVSEPLVQQQQQQQPPQQLQRQQSNNYSSVSHQVQQSNDYSSVSVYQDVNSGSGSVPGTSYGSFLGSNRVGQIKTEAGGGVGNSGLIRHSSSPAGLFDNIDMEKEFGVMRNMGDFGAGNASNAGPSFSSASRFKNHQLAPITEIESKRIGEDNRSSEQIYASVDNGGYISGFPMNAWDDSALFSDSFLSGLADDDNKAFSNTSTSIDQNSKGGSQQRARLAHHLSMPTSSSELSAMEQLLQDSVPCKVRAKRGCATHPRSIAERVRRTKISDRMRRLQELVPNMEKQTNTSDMLDLAVDYIKDLQTQVQKLSDSKEKCSCSPNQNPLCM